MGQFQNIANWIKPSGWQRIWQQHSLKSWQTLEAYLLALIGGALFAYGEQYLPPLFIVLPALLVGGAATFLAWKYNIEEEYGLENFLKPLTVFISVQILWHLVAQPLYGFAVPVLLSIIISILAIKYAAAKFSRISNHASDKVHRMTGGRYGRAFEHLYFTEEEHESGYLKYFLAIPLAVGLTFPIEKVYLFVFSAILPVIQPLRVSLYNISPLILVALFMIVSWYCAWRLRDDERLRHKVLPAATALLFAILLPMYEADGSGWWAFLTWGNAVEWLFVLSVLILGLSNSQRLLLGLGNTVGVMFCLLFALFSTVPSLHQFMIAQSMEIRQPTRLPLSTNTPRIMPYVIGQRRCLEGNAESATSSGAMSYTMESNGINYQCALHFDGFVAGDGWLSGLVSLIPGATYKIMRVESTNTSGEITPVEAIFPFGETNPVLKAAILARHPGATLGDRNFTYSQQNGKLRLVYSYTSSRLFWFTMVPTLGGAVVESENGLLQDYTASQAADQFGGAFLVPAELVRQKAEAWAHYRLNAWWPFRQEKELSEPSDTLNSLSEKERELFGNNSLPFAIPTQSGPKYWLLLEPFGTNGSAGSEILLFDARYPGLIEMKDTTKGRTVKGLRDVAKQAPAVVQGNFNLRGSDVYLHITAKDFYFIVPLLDSNAKFVGAAVLRSDEYFVVSGAVSTSEEVIQHIESFEKSH